MKRAPKRTSAKAPSKAKVGRPSLMTPTIVDDIMTAVEAGLPLEKAAALKRVGRTTVYAWLAAAEEPDPEPAYVEFRDRFEQSRARWALRLTVRIENDEKGGKGPLALLSMVDPKTYSVRVREITADAQFEMFRRLSESLDPKTYALVIAAYTGSFKAPEMRPSVADVKLLATSNKTREPITVRTAVLPPPGADPTQPDDRGRVYATTPPANTNGSK